MARPLAFLSNPILSLVALMTEWGLKGNSDKGLLRVGTVTVKDASKGRDLEHRNVKIVPIIIK